MKCALRRISGIIFATALSACVLPQTPPAGITKTDDPVKTSSEKMLGIINDLSILPRLDSRLAVGHPVSLLGTYEGWTACLKSSAKTRSDWVLKQGEHCIYVTGGLPKGVVPPPSSASDGMPVHVTGHLLKGADGQRWLLQFVASP
jgi:hypothetical protein